MISSKIRAVKNNRLAQNSFIVFVGSILGGLGGYLYNVLMSRLLGPADFGVLSSLISLFYIISVLSETLIIVICRYLAEFRAHGKLREARYFVNKINKWFLAAGAAVFILFILAGRMIASFLNIPSILPVAVLGSVFGVSLTRSVNVAGLRGLQRFSQFSIISILSSALKVVLGILFVWLGFGVNGALGALTVEAALVALCAYFSLGLPAESSMTKINISSLTSYAKPVFWTTFCIAAFYNIDVILAKHFFDSATAGYYSVLSLLGKIIFFGTGSVAIVLFPTVVDKHSRREKHSHILKYSFFLVLAGSLTITAFYFLVPGFIVNLLFGSSYVSIIPYVGYFGLVMTLFSLINLLAIYNLSIRRTKFVPILLLGLALEVSLIYFFHENISQIINGMLVAMSATFLALSAFQCYYSWR